MNNLGRQIDATGGDVPSSDAAAHAPPPATDKRILNMIGADGAPRLVDPARPELGTYRVLLTQDDIVAAHHGSKGWHDKKELNHLFMFVYGQNLILYEHPANGYSAIIHLATYKFHEPGGAVFHTIDKFFEYIPELARALRSDVEQAVIRSIRLFAMDAALGDAKRYETTRKLLQLARTHNIYDGMAFKGDDFELIAELQSGMLLRVVSPLAIKTLHGNKPGWAGPNGFDDEFLKTYGKDLLYFETYTGEAVLFHLPTASFFQLHGERYPSFESLVQRHPDLESYLRPYIRSGITTALYQPLGEDTHARSGYFYVVPAFLKMSGRHGIWLDKPGEPDGNLIDPGEISDAFRRTLDYPWHAETPENQHPTAVFASAITTLNLFADGPARFDARHNTIKQLLRTAYDDVYDRPGRVPAFVAMLKAIKGTLVESVVRPADVAGVFARVADQQETVAYATQLYAHIASTPALAAAVPGYIRAHYLENLRNELHAPMLPPERQLKAETIRPVLEHMIGSGAHLPVKGLLGEAFDYFVRRDDRKAWQSLLAAVTGHTEAEKEVYPRFGDVLMGYARRGDKGAVYSLLNYAEKQPAVEQAVLYNLVEAIGYAIAQGDSNILGALIPHSGRDAVSMQRRAKIVPHLRDLLFILPNASNTMLAGDTPAQDTRFASVLEHFMVTGRHNPDFMQALIPVLPQLVVKTAALNWPVSLDLLLNESSASEPAARIVALSLPAAKAMANSQWPELALGAPNAMDVGARVHDTPIYREAITASRLLLAPPAPAPLPAVIEPPARRPGRLAAGLHRLAGLLGLPAQG